MSNDNNNKHKNRNRGNSRKNPKKRESSRGKDVNVNEMGQSTTNDIAWYSHYPELTLNAGKLSMLYPAGGRVKFTKADEISLSAANAFNLKQAINDVPGIMGIEYVPTYGYSDSIKSPLTQMSRTTFNNMVAATNRVPNYEYTDLTVYQIAMTNLIQFYYWMCRIYLVAGTYSSLNLNWNKAVFKALGVNGTDIIANRSLLYSYIITFARRISAFPFPKSFDLFNRTASLVSNIYADGDEPKAQLYVFVPKGVYKWDTDSEVGASKLTFVPYTADITYNGIVSIGNTLLDSLQGSTDVQTMTADILKVYAADLVSVNIPPENGTISAVYDATILTQIMNMNWVGLSDITDLSGLDITQATDQSVLEPYMVSKPYIAQAKADAGFIAALGMRDMVNFLVPNPSEGTVLEGTRFKFTAKHDLTAEQVQLTSFGSEVATNLAIYVAAGPEPNSAFTKLSIDPGLTFIDAIVPTNSFKLLAALSNFDWHPRVEVFHRSNADFTYLGSFWDCSNYAFITDQQIQLMNDAAMFNLMRAFG